MYQLKSENWKRVLRGEEISCHKSQITRAQRQKERAAEELRKMASEIEAKLVEFQKRSDEIINEVMTTSCSAAEISQKSFEFTNFDASVKISRELAKITKMDQDILKDGIRLFEEYLASRIVPEDVAAIIRNVISNPSIQVINVLFAMTKTNSDVLFTLAVSRFKDAVMEYDTKAYTRVYEVGEDGKYRMINLSISKI